MSNYVSAEVPWTMKGNRRCLTGLQIMENPELKSFVDRFPDFFCVDPRYDVVWVKGEEPQS